LFYDHNEHYLQSLIGTLQPSTAVVRHKANDGSVVYAIWAWFNSYDTHCLEWYKFVICTRLRTLEVRYSVPTAVFQCRRFIVPSFTKWAVLG